METKERIKSRMLKNAAKIWGYKDTELETAYDPLVGLLMGALSVELEKVSDEIETSQARILDRLAQLLTPDVLTSSRPAHANLHARSSEPEMILAKEIQLYTIRKLGSNINNTREQSKEIFFSSALPFKLINGDIRYIANGKSISVFKNTFHKEPVTESASGAALDGLNLWIGFETNDRVKTLDGVAIYLCEGTFSGAAPAELVDKYHPLAEHLGKALKTHVVVSPVCSFPRLESGMAEQRFVLVMARPADYTARAIRDHGYRYVAQVTPDVSCVYLVPRDSPLKSLADAKGMRISLPEKTSYMGQLCVAGLRDAGVSVRQRANTMCHGQCHRLTDGTVGRNQIWRYTQSFRVCTTARPT